MGDPTAHILLTMANGPDNIGVYILEFSSYNAGIT